MTEAIDLERARVTLTDLPFVVHLHCSIQENGLGEEVTVHVKDCGLAVKRGTDERVSRMIEEKKEVLVILALRQALLNADAGLIAREKEQARLIVESK